jgi:two-component system chemotaxis sensor kinase CheA
MTFSDDRAAELKQLFFESAQELLQTLNEEALKLEQQPSDMETVRSIRRVVHTLKGDAAACGFRELSETAHELEDALALENTSDGAALVELSFTAADTFEGMLAAYQQNLKSPDIAPLRLMIAAVISGPREEAAETRKAEPEWLPNEIENSAIRRAATAGQDIFRVTIQIDPQCAMPIAARQLVINSLQQAGEILAEHQKNVSKSRLQFLLASTLTDEEIVSQCRIPTIVSEVKAARIEEHPAMSATGTASEVAGDLVEEMAASEKRVSPAVPESVLRVNAERIDAVLNLVGELIIGKSMLQQAVQEFTRHQPKHPLRGRFADALSFQARALTDLQRSVMKIRMVPVEQLFRRFPRMVRDVARQSSKQVDLELGGHETDLDKSLLDSVAEPLTHLVRNAIGHGIESPEEREKSGKPPRGKLQLLASHQGNQVVIEVRDDGRGIDVYKLKARAVQRHVVTAEEAARLSDAEALQLIFRPGFSTAEEITEISGRGVGLDVVQSVLQRLKGTVEIETLPGQGAVFRLKMPLTLAIIKALLFRIEDRLYAVPLNSVAEIMRAYESDLHQVDHYEILQLRGQALPIIRLGRPPVNAQQVRKKKIFVLVMAIGDRKMGLIVDSLASEEELVIKALDESTVSTDLVSGASILGDGRVVLILNLAAVVDRSMKSGNTAPGQVAFGLLLSQEEKIRLSMQAVAGGQS